MILEVLLAHAAPGARVGLGAEVVLACRLLVGGPDGHRLRPQVI
jgi:hypothetical protein